MALAVIQLPPDSTGKMVAARSYSEGGNTVYAQGGFLTTDTAGGNPAAVQNTAPAGTEYGLITRSIIGNGSNTATVSSNGSIQMQGYQPTATTFTAVTTVTALASTLATNFNVATVTLRTFTGTTPSITFRLEGSDDGGTTWGILQGNNNNNGQNGNSWTVAGPLTGGSAGIGIDYTIGAYTHIRINVTAISGASASAEFGLSLQTMSYEASPGVILNAYDGSVSQLVNATGKATQGARGLSTQDLKDAGRSARNITLDTFSVAATAETLMTMTYSTDNAATTTGTSYNVTAGKRFRIQSVNAYTSTTTGNTTSVMTILRLRVNAGGAGVLASPIQVIGILPGGGGVNFAQLGPQITIPDGWELPGGAGLAVTTHTPGFVATTAAPKVHISIIGYEY